ncbi:MAG: 50S ribosome-binding protein YggL [Clostridia bacterium]|jgi:uncharacterized protein YggL (DUF469 family)
MKKRLRKKLQLGEFRQLGFLITAKTDNLSDENLDKLIEFFELNNLYIGGVFSQDIRMVCMRKNPISCTDQDRKMVKTFLDNNTNINSSTISQLFDINHSNIYI